MVNFCRIPFIGRKCPLRIISGDLRQSVEGLRPTHVSRKRALPRRQRTKVRYRDWGPCPNITDGRKPSAPGSADRPLLPPGRPAPFNAGPPPARHGRRQASRTSRSMAAAMACSPVTPSLATSALNGRRGRSAASRPPAGRPPRPGADLRLRRRRRLALAAQQRRRSAAARRSCPAPHGSAARGPPGIDIEQAGPHGPPQRQQLPRRRAARLGLQRRPPGRHRRRHRHPLVHRRPQQAGRARAGRPPPSPRGGCGTRRGSARTGTARPPGAPSPRSRPPRPGRARSPRSARAPGRRRRSPPAGWRRSPAGSPRTG